MLLHRTTVRLGALILCACLAGGSVSADGSAAPVFAGICVTEVPEAGAVRLGSRVILFSPHPGRVRETFEVDLARPRNINNHDLADLSQQITSALKGYQNAAESD